MEDNIKQNLKVIMTRLAADLSNAEELYTNDPCSAYKTNLKSATEAYAAVRNSYIALGGR